MLMKKRVNVVKVGFTERKLIELSCLGRLVVVASLHFCFESVRLFGVQCRCYKPFFVGNLDFPKNKKLQKFA